MFFRRSPPDLFFDRIQCSDPFQRFSGYRRLVGYLEIVKPPAHMRPTGRFLNVPCLVDLIEPRVTIRLQRPPKLTQVRLGMFPLAIR